MNQSLLFNIDVNELERIQAELGATPEQVRAAYARALKRTSVTMKSRSLRLMRDSMNAKSLKAIRKRMQTYQSSFGVGLNDNRMDELKLWYGLNDVAVSKLKGRMTRIGTQRNPAGASFNSSKLGRQDYADGFVAKINKRKSIFSRKGDHRFPVKEKKMGISDDLHVQLEDEIFDELPEVFIAHFSTDLKGRVKASSVINQRKKNWNSYR
ncbi:hypothetical protein [Pseudoalteromonas sp. Of7M-16]|uniref:hypothetical protein n=1 Tax=Pseudoalteromonas sp. Of7M-16 TaxID=2917756 RepID=UPI001EF64AAD|nr:hypothetical protein [Pseudoalteromonas sp. Of7M-16]MCG7551567.1 hypothetical protein [Pseudoalteromonas sp. Of7M-16]